MKIELSHSPPILLKEAAKGKTVEGHSKNAQVISREGGSQGGVEVKEEDLEIDENKIKEKSKKIKKEEQRLRKLFKNLDENKKKIAEGQIKNAAFMSITLDELIEDIKINGVKEPYMNGKDQYGFKESIEVKTYNNMIKNYMNIIKQLNDLMPEEKKINEDDEFEKFNDSL